MSALIEYADLIITNDNPSLDLNDAPKLLKQFSSRLSHNFRVARVIQCADIGETTTRESNEFHSALDVQEVPVVVREVLKQILQVIVIADPNITIEGLNNMIRGGKRLPEEIDYPFVREMLEAFTEPLSK